MYVTNIYLQRFMYGPTMYGPEQVDSSSNMTYISVHLSQNDHCPDRLCGFPQFLQATAMKVTLITQPSHFTEIKTNKIQI